MDQIEKAFCCPFCGRFEADTAVDIEIHWSFGCPDYDDLDGEI